MEISSKSQSQSFTPELIDLFIPEKEISSNDVSNLFIVMEHAETDLKSII